MTVTVCIGNSDNKLTQQEWSDFVESVGLAIDCIASTWYFSGGPPNNFHRQNYAWVVECDTEKLDSLKRAVSLARAAFRQDSAAFVVGKTELI